MKAELQIWIDRAESIWLEALYNNAEALFRNKSLPSHDHTHHQRVWNLCQTLLTEISVYNSTIDEQLVEGLLIAAFFHDLGMADSTREDHGKLGSERCLSWFRDTGRAKPENIKEVLRAIELHDRKEQQIYSVINRESTPEIIAILSIADDLEAMGIIGIYRYAEIYLRRKIPLEELGIRILENAKTRFDKLSQGCMLCKHMIEKYRQQYEELCGFYKKYNLQLAGTAHPETECTGQLGVINYIRKQGIQINEIHHGHADVDDYFRKLAYELEQARL